MKCPLFGRQRWSHAREHGDLSEDRGGAGDEVAGSVATSQVGEIKWWQAAELIGISERQMRRWRKRLEEQGPKGLLDRRRGTPSPRRIAKEQAEEVLSLYQDRYFDLNVRHFHQKLGQEHQIGLSYTWVKQALQAAGLVRRKARRGVHRKRRERRPLPGMMLHIDGSDHRWFQDERRHDLIVILDDATSEIYYAQLAEEETTATVMAGLRAVTEQKGLFCSLYSDRGAHFWLTPKSGGKVDYERPTQVGRAMKELGVHMIPAYSPQARGRSERNFSTWQGRLPQEWRLRGIRTLEGANKFLNALHRRVQPPLHGAGSAARNGVPILPAQESGNGLHPTIRAHRRPGQHRALSNLVIQIERAEWRPTLAGCKVIIPSALGHYPDPHDRRTSRRTLQRGRKAVDAADQETNQGRGKDVERKSHKTDFPSQLANPAHYAAFALSHRLYDGWLTE
jgi:transposase